MLSTQTPEPRINYDMIKAHYDGLFAMAEQPVHTLYKQLYGLFKRLKIEKTTVHRRTIVCRSEDLSGIMFRPDGSRVHVFTKNRHWIFVCNTSLVTLLRKLQKHNIISEVRYTQFMKEGLGLRP